MVHETPSIQTNFSSGELDPLVHGRTDSAAYANGLARALNVTLYNTGGLARRPGTTIVADLGSMGRLIEFEYDDNNQFIIVLQNLIVQVLTKDGTQVAVFNSPWWTEILSEVSYSQLGEAMIFSHGLVNPWALTFHDGSVWSFGYLSYETSINGEKIYQPYEKFAAYRGISLRPSTISGYAFIYANAPFFRAEHLYSRLRIFDAEVYIAQVDSPTQIVGLILGVLEGKLLTNAFRVIRGTANVEVTHLAHGLATGDTMIFSGVSDIMTVAYAGTGSATYSNISSDQLNGAHIITVLDQDRYQFTITLSSGNTGPAIYQTIDGGGANIKFEATNKPIMQWMEQVFSAARGWPRAVTFHEQRLWFGGTRDKPDGVWSSQVARYNNFDVGTGADNESIQASIGSDLGAVVKHLTSNRHLQIYTSTSELYCPPPTNSSLTPATFRVAPQTRYGANGIRPRTLDGATLYVQANGKTVRENIYTDTEQAYTSTSVSLLGAHLITGPVELGVLRGSATRGEQMAAIVNADGTIALFTSARSEKMAGWVPWTTAPAGDQFKSVCALGSVFYFTVKRGPYYFLERLTPDDTLPLDGAFSFLSSPAKSVWTVTWPYFNRVVSVINHDGTYCGEFLIGPAGQLDISPSVATGITVGYAYPFWVKTLPPAVETPRGKRSGAVQRIAEATILFNQSASAKVNGQRLTLRTVYASVETAAAWASRPERFFFRGYSREPSIEIVQDEALPIRILYIRSKVVA